jgi:integrase
MRTRLTTTFIAAATCPADKKDVPVWDAACPGLAVRVFRTGFKGWYVRYRPGKGRAVAPKWLALGSVEKLGVADARDVARRILGEVALGRDPAGAAAQQKAEAKAAKVASLATALDEYDAELQRRKIVKRSEVISILRRELRDKLGASADLRTMTRQRMVERIDALAKDRPGAAAYLRKAATGFLEWAANRGVIPVSPLAGYRKPRRSRAELLDRPGRALDDNEIRKLWAATDTRFGTLVRICLLTGVRRGVAASMEWGDLDLEAGEWLIRAEVAKTGRQRIVYLAPLAVELLRAVPRIAGEPLVFPSDAGTIISGWTKRVSAVVKAAGVDFAMHDTRRSFRTGLSRLGVDRDTAELCLGHWRGDLVETYDRDGAKERQRRACTRWAEHVARFTQAQKAKVMPIRQQRSA